MGKKRKELSHEEIWDDSGLVESWNQSYEEYKQYHSIHSRGENVKELIEQAEAEQAAENNIQHGVSNSKAIAQADEELEDGEIDEVVPKGARHIAQPVSYEAANTPQLEDPPNTVPSAMPEPATAFMGVAGASTQDPGLKNLMMSWYWAGYYTGFYEGQRPAGATTTNATTSRSGT